VAVTYLTATNCPLSHPDICFSTGLFLFWFYAGATRSPADAATWEPPTHFRWEDYPQLLDIVGVVAIAFSFRLGNAYIIMIDSTASYIGTTYVEYRVFYFKTAV
jgi:hypothetical protein